MQTTAILVENLIQGLQTLLWIALFSFSIYDYEQILFLTSERYFTIAIGVVIGIIYLLGIVVDTVYYNLIIQRFESKWVKRYVKNKNETLLTMYFECILFNAELARFFQEKQSHLRMIRVTVVNIPLMTLGLLSFNVFALQATKFSSLLLILLIGGVAELVIIYAWKKLYKYYVTIIEKAFLEINHNRVDLGK